MYNTIPAAATTSGLAFTGAVIYGSLALAVAFFVIGGTLLAVLSLAPRLAWEPISGPKGYRMRVTFNGRPIRNRK
jgi:hypothetical protein